MLKPKKGVKTAIEGPDGKMRYFDGLKPVSRAKFYEGEVFLEFGAAGKSWLARTPAGIFRDGEFRSQTKEEHKASWHKQFCAPTNRCECVTYFGEESEKLGPPPATIKLRARLIHESDSASTRRIMMLE